MSSETSSFLERRNRLENAAPKDDPRSKHFKARSVEVDALPPVALLRIVREAIVRHFNRRALRLVRAEEQQERAELERMVEEANMNNDAFSESNPSAL